jgi:hypothetical protein
LWGARNHSCLSLAIATLPPSFNNFSCKSHSWAFFEKNVHVAFNYKQQQQACCSLSLSLFFFKEEKRKQEKKKKRGRISIKKNK